jgi:hypothetical protein
VKRSAILIFLVTIGTEVSADRCTYQVEEYIEGVLLPITHEKYVSQDKVDWAKTEANRVFDLRKKMPDCNVSQHISLMSHVGESVKNNNKEIEKLEAPNKINRTNNAPKKKHLYRY